MDCSAPAAPLLRYLDHGSQSGVCGPQGVLEGVVSGLYSIYRLFESSRSTSTHTKVSHGHAL